MKGAESRCLLISDFTVNGLAPLLAAHKEPPMVQAQVAPFGQVVSILLSEKADCWRWDPETAVVWTRPQSAIPSFARLLNYELVSAEEILAEVDQFANALREAAKRVTAVFVPTWTIPCYERGPGLLNMSAKFGPAYHLMRMNARLVESVAESNIYVLDAGRWVSQAGENACNPKLWHMGKIAFGPETFKHAAADIKAGVRALRGLSRKLIVLDLDDTIWGGIVGDLGWENLRVGGHDPVGEAFRVFQLALKAMGNRGIILGIVSKNTEAVALEAIDKHPEMILRRGDFAGWRINWQDKVQNLIELTADLNLGLDSVVFIDDNPAERARVRAALPQVLVPEWPTDKLQYEKALKELDCFDTAGISEEDQARTRMYSSERERIELRQSAQSYDEYLASLGLQVKVEPLDAANLRRAAQLLNKTNQMNLTSRRMTESQYSEWAQADRNQVCVFRVTDRFDDYGLTGVASMEVREPNATIIDFVVSCRVMGRGVEQAMLHALVEHGRSLGLEQICATYVPTARNAPCKMFFDEQSNFSPSENGTRYTWDLSQLYPAPRHVEIHWGEMREVASVR
jgi:FkbH-like protein